AVRYAAASPGCLGGAAGRTAGAHGPPLAVVLDWARLSRLGETAPAVLPAAELGMRYRSSNLDDNDVVCAARLALTPAAPDEIREIALRMQRYRDHRAATQPGEARNAGSMFKNPAGSPPGVSAGRLIEAAGMKGHRTAGP